MALLEHWIRFWLIEHHPLGLPHMVAMFDWHRFIAIQLWIFVLFLIYETATELNHLFGEGELWHLLVTSRPSELPLNRRQRILILNWSILCTGSWPRCVPSMGQWKIKARPHPKWSPGSSSSTTKGEMVTFDAVDHPASQILRVSYMRHQLLVGIGHQQIGCRDGPVVFVLQDVD